jgi:hypothetical protein
LYRSRRRDRRPGAQPAALACDVALLRQLRGRHDARARRLEAHVHFVQPRPLSTHRPGAHAWRGRRARRGTSAIDGSPRGSPCAALPAGSRRSPSPRWCRPTRRASSSAARLPGRAGSTRASPALSTLASPSRTRCAVRSARRRACGCAAARRARDAAAAASPTPPRLTRPAPQVGDVFYHSSQPWPNGPAAQLMLGAIAVAESEALHVVGLTLTRAPRTPRTLHVRSRPRGAPADGPLAPSGARRTVRSSSTRCGSICRACATRCSVRRRTATHAVRPRAMRSMHGTARPIGCSSRRRWRSHTSCSVRAWSCAPHELGGGARAPFPYQHGVHWRPTASLGAADSRALALSKAGRMPHGKDGNDGKDERAA